VVACAAGGYFLLLAQKEVTKEKGRGGWFFAGPNGKKLIKMAYAPRPRVAEN